MLLSELNLKALNINAQTVLPVEQSIDVEGKVLKIKIVNFQSNYGSGKKSVVSGSASYGNTTYEFINKDVIGFRASVAKTLGIKNTAKVTRIRASKEQTEVEKLRQSLAVARRLCPFNEFSNPWLIINVKALRAHFRLARKEDRIKAQEALKARAVDPLLAKIEKLTPEERALLLASLQ